MPGRLAQGVLIGMLLTGGLGGIVAIVATLDKTSGPLGPPPTPSARRDSAATIPLPTRPWPFEDPGADPEPEPPEDVVAGGAPPVVEPGGEEPDSDRAPEAYAELTLELLAYAEAKGEAIGIRVVDTAGEPIPGVLIVVREGAAMLYRERTGAGGEAEFAPYPGEQGPFRIDAMAEGYVAASSDRVEKGGEVELILRMRGIIEGRVRSPARGKGVVRLLTDHGERSAPIAEDGSFLFEDVDEGAVTVQAVVEPFGSDSQSFWVEGEGSYFVRLRIRKSKRIRIFGQFSFWPGKGTAKINGHSVAVSATGRYEFDKAIDGVNELLVDAPGRALSLERFTVKAHETTRHDFRLRREARIKGSVANENTRLRRRGTTLEGVEVRLGVEFDDPDNDRVPLFPIHLVPVVRTDRNGRFEIGRLDNRMTYLVSVVGTGYGGALVRVMPQIGRVRLILPEGPYLFGKVRGLGGIPRDAVVTAQRLEEHPSSRVFNVENYDGAVTLRESSGFYGLSGLLNGIYVIRVAAPDFGTLETVVDLEDGRRHRFDLRLRKGQQFDQDDIELLKRLPPAVYTSEEDPALGAGFTSLHIDVADPQRAAFKGVHVRFFHGDVEILPPMLFDEQQFDLYGLPAANYRAILEHPTLAKPEIRSPVILEDGKPYNLTFR